MGGQKGPIEDDELSLPEAIIKFASLPEDVIKFEIFSRLPVKSLCQLGRDSEWFRSLTTHPGFLDAYHHRRRCHYILSFWSSPQWDSVFYSIEPDSGWKARATSINEATNLHYNTYAKSINGLMCISRKLDVSICQSATNETRSLPRIPPCNEVRQHSQYIYFCYDPNSERYKVLRAVSISDNVFPVTPTSYWIFTIGLDKSWRIIPDAPKLYHLRKGKSVCIDGSLYCTNFSTEEDDGVIARFDVAGEYFGMISYPEGLSSSRYSSCYIIELKGSLCVIDTGDLMKSCFMTIWIHNSKSWMESRIEFPSSWQIMVNIWQNCSFCNNSDGEIVVAVSGISTVGYCILIYNVERQKWRKMEVLGLAERTILGDFLIEEAVESPCLLSNIFSRKRKRSK
ncbi:hypothetical protein CDL12_01319 [Handroanthus impetiginosus]|uniref:F-box associated beta-propeller type 3 domain-containing protein n=1 Tax=Handroanthus impetiginosus TaxID=429701 RepID=A0A2G9I832_9LAMI|nr:hypothetical protein CDL12_01319 [Handroanthus impetiginosus]